MGIIAALHCTLKTCLAPQNIASKLWCAIDGNGVIIVNQIATEFNAEKFARFRMDTGLDDIGMTLNCLTSQKGNRTLKVTPLSGFGRKETSPLWASAIFFTIPRPRPVPPFFVEKKG